MALLRFPLLSPKVYHARCPDREDQRQKKPVPQLAQDPIVLCLNLWDSIKVERDSTHADHSCRSEPHQRATAGAAGCHRLPVSPARGKRSQL